jgi:Mn2+/Fe2+ NRAMP family transporter
VIIIVIVTVLFALADSATGDSNIDHYGHIGGFITGLPFSMAIMPILATSMGRNVMPGWTYEKYCKVVGAVVAFLWLSIGMIMFYTQRNPVSYCDRIDKLLG